MKPRQYQCTCKIYLAELRVFICNTFTSICPRNDLCTVHKVVFKWPYSALSACQIRWYKFLEEINSDYSSINPNKMIYRIKWKECTGKFTLIAGIQGNLLIFRGKSFDVFWEIFLAGAKLAQKMEVTTFQTYHEIRPVQLQVKSGLWILRGCQLPE